MFDDSTQFDSTQLLSQALFIQVVGSLSDGILLYADDQSLVYSNDSAKSILRVPSSTEIPKEIYGTLYEIFQSQGSQGSQSERTEVNLAFGESETAWLELIANSIVVEGQVFKMIQLRDISLLKDKESMLHREANTDYMSGLANRRQFRRMLDEHAGSNLCLGVIDVDHFKSINDEFGHTVGDSTIRFVAEQLIEYFGNEVCVARLGGEEFGVVLKVLDHDNVVRQFEEFRSAVASSSFCEGQIKLTVSVGLAFASTNENDIFNLLVQADKALYESKNSGRNRLTVAT